MSDLFVDNIKHQSSQGSGTITLGASGETVALASGASQTMAVNTPAFYAYKNASQIITSGTTTKITFETELFDTANAFASSKFTPAVAGKYYIETGLTMQGGTSELIESRIYIYKNGSNYSYGYGAHQNNYSNYEARTWSTIVDCNTTDYIEIYSNCSDSSGNPTIAQHNPKGSWFLGYKLIT